MITLIIKPPQLEYSSSYYQRSKIANINKTRFHDAVQLRSNISP